MAQRSLQTTKLTAGVSDHRSDRHTAGASGDNYQELVAQVRSLSQQLRKLRADSGETGANKRGACWNCGRPGHFRRNCPQRRPTKGKTTPERSAEFTSAVTCTLTLQGEVEGRITPMLVDTGSSVTLLHERVWKEAVQGRRKLQPSAGPVKAVNGENIPICGQAEVSFQVGEYVGVHKVLVVKEMIQECLLGTDFLEKGDCVIDVKNKLLTIAGCTKPVHLFLGECAFTYHVMVHESTVIPAFHQVQLPVDLELVQEKRVPDSIGFFEPKPEFPDKRGGLLLAHSVSPTRSGKTTVQLLNPTAVPVTLYGKEKIGELSGMRDMNMVGLVEPSLDRKPAVRSKDSEAIGKAIEGGHLEKGTGPNSMQTREIKGSLKRAF